MPEDDESDVTMSDFQKLITQVVPTCVVNGWSFAVDFAPDGEASLHITVPADPVESDRP